MLPPKPSIDLINICGVGMIAKDSADEIYSKLKF
jgi:hypothetical protein